MDKEDLRTAVLADMLEKGQEKGQYDLSELFHPDKDQATKSFWEVGYRLALCANAMAEGILSGLDDCDEDL